MNLSRLHYDALFHLSQYLDIQDLVHLGKTCKRLLRITYDARLCRLVLKVENNVTGLEHEID